MSFATRMFMAEALKLDFRRSLTVIERKSPQASKQGKTECCRSGVCCWRRPGEINEDDIKRLSARLGLTEQEFFAQYLVVDDFRGQRLLRLRRSHEEGGRMLSWEATYSISSPCVFLRPDDGNACAVHEDKPAKCREYKCWEGDGPPHWEAFTDERLTALGWSGFNPDDCEDD